MAAMGQTVVMAKWEKRWKAVCLFNIKYGNQNCAVIASGGGGGGGGAYGADGALRWRRWRWRWRRAVWCWRHMWCEWYIWRCAYYTPKWANNQQLQTQHKGWVRRKNV